MRNPLIGLVSAVVLTSTMATNGCGSSPSGGGAGNTGGGRANNGGISGGGSNGNGGISSGGSSGNGGISSRGSSGNGGISSGGSSGNGGSPGSGGSAGSTGECPGMTPCGGDVVGTWTVISSCLNVTGELDLSLAVGPACPSGPITGSLRVTGTWTANPNGTYLDNTTTSGDEQLTLASSCLVISSTPNRLRWRGQPSQERLGLLQARLPICCGRRVQLLGHRQTDGRDWRAVHGPADKRQLHDLGQRAHNFGRPGGRQVLILRLGEQADPDPAEHEADHDGHDRAAEEQQLGFGRCDRQRRAGRFGWQERRRRSHWRRWHGRCNWAGRFGRQERRRRSHWRRWLQRDGRDRWRGRQLGAL